MYTIIIEVVCLIVGFIAGASFVHYRKKAYLKQIRIGKLRMDDTTGDPYLFLELSVPIEVALHQKECVMEVDLNPITQD